MALIEVLLAEAKLKAAEKRVKNMNLYSIVDQRTNVTVFVGSTSQTESQKMACHRSSARAGNTQPIHEFMQKNGVDNYKMIPLETFKFSDKANVAMREQQYINQFKPVCNLTVKAKVVIPLTCYCGCVIQGVAAMKRHLNLPKHNKIVDKEPLLTIRHLFE